MILQKDNVQKIEDNPARIAALLSAGFVPVDDTVSVEPFDLAPPVIIDKTLTHPVITDTSDDEDALKWRGEYISGLYRMPDLRACCKDLGIDFQKAATRDVLKRKLAAYAKSVHKAKKERKAVN